MAIFDAVIFDMDGLLVDSEPVWWSCEAALLERRGKTWDQEIQHKLVGLRMDDFLGGMIKSYNLTDTFEVMRDELLTQMCERIPGEALVRPGAPELLAYLQQQGIPCAIASSSSLVIIE